MAGLWAEISNRDLREYEAGLLSNREGRSLPTVLIEDYLISPSMLYECLSKVLLRN
jgi:hypothetical protein